MAKENRGGARKNAGRKPKEYAIQYQNNSGRFIKVYQIDNEGKITEMTLKMR